MPLYTAASSTTALSTVPPPEPQIAPALVVHNEFEALTNRAARATERLERLLSAYSKQKVATQPYNGHAYDPSEFSEYFGKLIDYSNFIAECLDRIENAIDRSEL